MLEMASDKCGKHFLFRQMRKARFVPTNAKITFRQTMHVRVSSPCQRYTNYSFFLLENIDIKYIKCRPAQKRILKMKNPFRMPFKFILWQKKLVSPNGSSVNAKIIFILWKAILPCQLQFAKWHLLMINAKCKWRNDIC